MSFGMGSGVWPSCTTWPLLIVPCVAPFAPGNLPKYSSKLRFSLRMMTTCLIGVCAEAAAGAAGAAASARLAPDTATLTAQPLPSTTTTSATHRVAHAHLPPTDRRPRNRGAG
jgi:hypothetical protein